METYSVLGERVHVCLFLDFDSSSELRSRLINAASLTGDYGSAEREWVNFAFIDASLILSALHLRTAIQQALLARAGNTLRTKTIHSEILYALHPTHNISDAIRHFGVSGQTRSLLVVRVGNTDSHTNLIITDTEVRSKMVSIIRGRALMLKDGLDKVTDWIRVLKLYKVSKPGNSSFEPSKHTAHDYVVTLVASKSILL